MLNLVILFALFAYCYAPATPVSWSLLSNGFYPSSYPAVFLRQGTYHIFVRGASSNLLYATCPASSCTGPLSFKDLGGDLGGSPGAAYLKDTEFHVFVPKASDSTNATVDWINSTDAGATWRPWQARPMSKPIRAGTSITASPNILNHIVTLSVGWDKSLNRDYFYDPKNPNPWNFLKLSSASQKFDETNPILVLGWVNDSTVDVKCKKFHALGIDTSGCLLQNGWDAGSPGSWAPSMNKIAGLTGLSGSALFGAVEPGTSETAKLRIFLSLTNGTLLHATRTWDNRNVNLVSQDFQPISTITLGSDMCSRPAGYSNEGVVTLFSVGKDGGLYKTSFLPC